MGKKEFDLIVVGGGAAGFFGAIQLAERKPSAKICILEKSNATLSKVRVSGGGRCNVTHACFIPKEMVGFYPRGHKELLGPFHQFLCGDMMEWLAHHGVETKIEGDGRVFPCSDRSETIIQVFTKAADRYGIQVLKRTGLKDFIRVNNAWRVIVDEDEFHTSNLLISTGSSNQAWKLLEKKGVPLIPPKPSLFTFNIQHGLISDLPGLSFPQASVRIPQLKMEDSGPLLITHWGLSGPAILKLSAWAARDLADLTYQFPIDVNWIGEEPETVVEEIQSIRKVKGSQRLAKAPLFELPTRFWMNLLDHFSLTEKRFADLSKRDISNLVSGLTQFTFTVNGKSTFKEEFVTCGGVDTRSVNFKTMESKILPGVYFAGEVLNIDAVTGGFNFQAAWTTAFISARSIATGQE